MNDRRNFGSFFLHIRWNSNFARIVYSVAILAILLSYIRPTGLAGTFAQLNLSSLAISLVLIFFGQYLSSVRLYYLLADSNIAVPKAEVYSANIYSIVGGMLFFNVFGQGITRSLLLNKFKVPQSSVFVLTALERAVALFLLLVAALVSVIILFNRFPLSFDSGGIAMLRYLLAAVAVFAFACWLGLTRRQRRLFRLLAGNTYSRATLRLIVITILMHGAMLAAYALVATSLVPQANIGEVLACSVIVMLAASLPISFAGWGFRELSATIVFARLGFMPGQGFVIGVVIGVLSIVALMGHIAWLGFHKPKSISDTASGGKWVDTSPLERAAYWLIGLGATAAVLFNIRVPTNTGQLNVNLGDPVAIIGGIVLLGLAWQTRTLSSLWHARGIVLSMALITAVLTLGLLHGYLVYGPIDWAIFNRFFGWFLLLAYFGTGSLLVAIAGQTGFAALSRVLVASTAAIVVFDFVQVILARVFRMTFGLEVPFRAEGMAANPNAYAFQLLLAFVVLLASADFRERGDRAIRPILMAGLYLYGLWLAGSRASLGTFAVLLVVIGVVYWREIDLKKFYTRMALGVVAALIILAAPLVIGYAVNFAASLLSIPTSRVFNPFITGFIATKSDIQADRIESIRGGLALWMAHPIFGGGLGAYIRQHIEQTGTALIIHNSMLWVAAELGIVGFAIFAMPAVLVVRAVFANRQWSDISSKVVIIGCMVVMFVMSLVHDMFYQRLFWLLMGAGLTVPYATMRTMRLSRRKLALAPGKSAEVEPPAAGHAGGL